MGNTLTIVGAPSSTVFRCNYCDYGYKWAHSPNHLYVYDNSRNLIYSLVCENNKYAIRNRYNVQLYKFNKKLPNKPTIICTICFYNGCSKFKRELDMKELYKNSDKKNSNNNEIVSDIKYPTSPENNKCIFCDKVVTNVSKNSTKIGYVCEGHFRANCCSIGDCLNKPLLECMCCNNNFCNDCWDDHRHKINCGVDGLNCCGEYGLDPYYV